MSCFYKYSINVSYAVFMELKTLFYGNENLGFIQLGLKV